MIRPSSPFTMLLSRHTRRQAGHPHGSLISADASLSDNQKPLTEQGHLTLVERRASTDAYPDILEIEPVASRQRAVARYDPLSTARGMRTVVGL
jgi:hypothetical protein